MAEEATKIPPSPGAVDAQIEKDRKTIEEMEARKRKLTEASRAAQTEAQKQAALKEARSLHGYSPIDGMDQIVTDAAMPIVTPGKSDAQAGSSTNAATGQTTPAATGPAAAPAPGSDSDAGALKWDNIEDDKEGRAQRVLEHAWKDVWKVDPFTFSGPPTQKKYEAALKNPKTKAILDAAFGKGRDALTSGNPAAFDEAFPQSKPESKQPFKTGQRLELLTPKQRADYIERNGLADKLQESPELLESFRKGYKADPAGFEKAAAHIDSMATEGILPVRALDIMKPQPEADAPKDNNKGPQRGYYRKPDGKIAYMDTANLGAGVGGLRGPGTSTEVPVKALPDFGTPEQQASLHNEFWKQRSPADLANYADDKGNMNQASVDSMLQHYQDITGQDGRSAIGSNYGIGNVFSNMPQAVAKPAPVPAKAPATPTQAAPPATPQTAQAGDVKADPAGNPAAGNPAAPAADQYPVLPAKQPAVYSADPTHADPMSFTSDEEQGRPPLVTPAAPKFDEAQVNQARLLYARKIMAARPGTTQATAAAEAAKAVTSQALEAQTPKMVEAAAINKGQQDQIAKRQAYAQKIRDQQNRQAALAGANGNIPTANPYGANPNGRQLYAQQIVEAQKSMAPGANGTIKPAQFTAGADGSRVPIAGSQAAAAAAPTAVDRATRDIRGTFAANQARQRKSFESERDIAVGNAQAARARGTNGPDGRPIDGSRPARTYGPYRLPNNLAELKIPAEQAAAAAASAKKITPVQRKAIDTVVKGKGRAVNPLAEAKSKIM